ncbi:hypothetical protein [Treponema denticola]|uniref:hypothetical protein n=1 Tax=Treponema denticola TaxID=158 RepID=UPI0020A4EEBB|nr:hypothetical protein [Treponema denticola]
MKIYRTLFDIQIFNQFLQLYYYALFLWRIKNRTEDTGFLRAEPLSSYFEDRRGIGKGNNQQRFEVKKLLSDKSVFPSLTTAPVNDEAKKHNENLPGLGGVYNTVNLHVYHYAGNNPVKYVDPDGRVSCGTEVILRIDGYLDKNNAFGMAKILYQYSKNPSEGALSSIATAGVVFFGVAPAIASSLVSLVLALSNDKKNQINDLAFSIMTAVSEYGDLLDSGEYSIHVSGTMTTKNTIEFFRRKDEQLSNITTFSSDLNFTLVDKDGKEIKHLGKYTADPSAIKELLDKYSEKPIKVIEFNGGLPIKVERLE